MESEIVTRWSSRKFWTMAVSQVFVTILFILDKLDQDGFIWLTCFILGSYLAANVIQHVMPRR